MSNNENDLDEDTLRDGYDLTKLTGRVQGKHFESYRIGTNLALLAPDVRAAFPTDDSVNAALRSLIEGA